MKGSSKCIACKGRAIGIFICSNNLLMSQCCAQARRRPWDGSAQALADPEEGPFMLNICVKDSINCLICGAVRRQGGGPGGSFTQALARQAEAEADWMHLLMCSNPSLTL